MRGLARWPSLAIALISLFAAERAFASSRVVILEFSGRKADVLREQVAHSLKEAGHSVVLSKSSSQGASGADLRRVAKKAKADAVITGHVRRHSMRLWSVALNVSDGEAGASLGPELKFRSTWLPGLAKDLSDTAANRLQPALAQVGSIADPEPDPAPEPEPEPEPTGRAEVWDADTDGGSKKGAAESSAGAASAAVETAGEGSSDSLFEVDPEVIPERDDAASDAGEEEDSGSVAVIRARGGVVHRTIDFSDDLYQRLRAQTANIWVYQVDAAIYPFERPIGERLGVIASFESVFSGNVRDTDFGNNFPVIFQEFFAGLRARHPLGPHQIGFDLTFGRMLSGLEDQNGAAQIPDMSYTLMRAALDFNIDIGQLQFVGSAGFRLPFGYGEVATTNWFPRVGGYGFEAFGGLNYPVSKKVSIEATGGVRRYLLEMNSEPQDAIDGISEVAGGAVDLYTSACFGVSFRL